MLRQNNQSALIELHFVVFIWGFTAILGKLITLEALQLVWYRMILALVGVYIFARYSKAVLTLPRKTQWQLAGTGLIIAAHWVTFYHAIKISNVSVTLACFSSGAFFASIFEPLLYKRRVIWYELLLGVVAIVGLYLIFSFESTYLAGMLTAIFSAALSALFAVINGQYAQKYNASVVSVYEMAGGVLGLSILMLLGTGYASGSYALSGSDLSYLSILAIVCTAYPFIASIRLMRKITPYTFVLSVNMEPIYGIILAYFIFGESEKMTSQFYVGTAVILGTLFANAILKHYYRKKAEKIGTFAAQP
ncbi:MAG: DMT family transporter [Sphingobacteriaceae bacterium]|nr:DMT family transporter [Sphingobacteriaceae bacterium]